MEKWTSALSFWGCLPSQVAKLVPQRNDRATPKAEQLPPSMRMIAITIRSDCFLFYRRKVGAHITFDFLCSLQFDSVSHLIRFYVSLVAAKGYQLFSVIRVSCLWSGQLNPVASALNTYMAHPLYVQQSALHWISDSTLHEEVCRSTQVILPLWKSPQLCELFFGFFNNEYPIQSEHFFHNAFARSIQSR